MGAHGGSISTKMHCENLRVDSCRGRAVFDLGVTQAGVFRSVTSCSGPVSEV